MTSSLKVRTHAVTFGELDESEHPQVGAMMINSPVLGVIPLCSGTLIHERGFLTAGHCVDIVAEWIAAGLMSASDVHVSFSTDNPYDPATWHAVDAMFLSPDFAFGASEPTRASDVGDLGLLILTTPVGGLTPVALPSPGYLDDLKQNRILPGGSSRATFTLVGYGCSLDFPPAEVIWDNGPRRNQGVQYQSMNQFWLVTHSNPQSANGGICFGDSGGPILWNDQHTGEKTLVAIVSWGNGNWIGNNFSYRIDTANALSFIDTVLSSIDP